ncbi:phage baseplate assembly protein V [Primorskyibacter sp. 2E107]|uniref:phage baseplate assembly protein V n=1 Tax=Primorskyibacter sp. 2E107 TaxID=3403458 RepID=UPI003AF465E7
MARDNTEQLTDIVTRRYYGKYRGEMMGVVTLSRRPRVTVKVPAVLGDATLPAEVCVPYAEDQAGFLMVPENGSLIWVEFEAGDPRFPIWVGCLWPDGAAPVQQMQLPGKKMLKTGVTTLELDDTARTATLSTSRGPQVAMAGDVKISTGVATPSATVSSSAVELSTTGIGSVSVTSTKTSVNNGGLDVT